MKTIYTIPEYEKLGFSGGKWWDFYIGPFLFSITRGSTSSGAAPSVLAYYIHVIRLNTTVIDMFVYPGSSLFIALEVAATTRRLHLSDPTIPEVQQQLANHIFTEAMGYVKIIDLVSNIMNESYKEGFQDGKVEVQDDIKEALGL